MPTSDSSTFLTVLVAVVSYTLYGAIYRLFLSPLRKIPGPRLAALKYWYETYYEVWKPGQYAFKIKELHEHYGKLARTWWPEPQLTLLRFEALS